MEKVAVARVHSSAAGGEVPSSAQRRLDELYANHSAPALRLAYLLTGDAGEAEDVVQEAFVRMFVRFRDHKSPLRAEAYLRRCIVNLAHDRHRRQKTLRSFLARSVPSAAAVEAPGIEGRLVMRARLRLLPYRQRAALVLRYYEDLSESHAAEVLQCSVGALKKLVQRGLRTMREQERHPGDSDE